MAAIVEGPRLGLNGHDPVVDQELRRDWHSGQGSIRDDNFNFKSYQTNGQPSMFDARRAPFSNESDRRLPTLKLPEQDPAVSPVSNFVQDYSTTVSPITSADSPRNLNSPATTDAPHDSSTEPLKSILRRKDEDDAPSEIGSAEQDGSMRSVSSFGQSQTDLQARGTHLPHLITSTSSEASPTDQEGPQVNFSRPKRTKPGISRIPVSKSSPLAKSSSSGNATDSPHTPSRKGSIKHARNSLEALSVKKNRLSSAKIENSEPLQDPPNSSISVQPIPSAARTFRNSSLASQNSNKRRSMPDSKGLPRSGGRVSSGQGKQRTVSVDSQGSFTQRQRANSTPRRPPGPLNRPEGDPPWLATMFKPDPRLPPEQQMLPTHAKRLAMQQGTYVPPTDVPEHVNPQQQNLVTEATTADAIPQRASSMRDLLRRVSQKSKKSQELSTPPQQQHQQRNEREPATSEPQSGEADWPLRTSSPKPDSDDVFAQSVAVQTAPTAYTTTTNSERNERMSQAPTVTPTPPSTAAPSTKLAEPTMLPSRAAPAPATPQVPLQKQEKEPSCGCCIVM